MVLTTPFLAGLRSLELRLVRITGFSLPINAQDLNHSAAPAVLASPVSVRAQDLGFSRQRWRILGAGISTCSVRWAELRMTYVVHCYIVTAFCLPIITSSFPHVNWRATTEANAKRRSLISLRRSKNHSAGLRYILEIARNNRVFRD